MENQDTHTYSTFLRDNRKELAVLLLLGALAGAAYYFFSFSLPTQIKPFEEKGVLDLYQITVNDYQKERKKWKLIGQRALISEKSKRMRIEQVKIWVYAQDNSTVKSSADPAETANNSPQKVDLVITADQGLIERRDNRVTLSGNVVLLRDDGSEVFTETAIYDAKKRYSDNTETFEDDPRRSHYARQRSHLPGFNWKIESQKSVALTT